jgi:hypothetical protein
VDNRDWYRGWFRAVAPRQTAGRQAAGRAIKDQARKQS